MAEATNAPVKPGADFIPFDQLLKPTSSFIPFESLKGGEPEKKWESFKGAVGDTLKDEARDVVAARMHSEPARLLLGAVPGVAEFNAQWLAPMGAEVGSIGRGLYESAVKAGNGEGFVHNFKQGYESVKQPFEQHIAQHLQTETEAGKALNKAFSYPMGAIRWFGERVVDEALKHPSTAKYAPELGALWEGWAQAVGLGKAADLLVNKAPVLAHGLAHSLGKAAAEGPNAVKPNTQDALAQQLQAHFQGEAKTAPQANATWKVNGVDQPVNVTKYLGEQNGEHYYGVEGSSTGVPGSQLQAAPGVLEGLRAKSVADAPTVDDAIKAAVDATSKPIQVPTPLEVHQSRIAWRQKWKTIQDIQAAFDQHKARQEALKEAELNQVQQAHREAPLTPEDLANAQAMEPVTETPKPEQPQPETAMSRALKEAQGRDLLQRMEAWNARRQQDALREQGTAAVDVRQPPEHGEALGEGNTGHQRPTPEEKAQAARPNRQPNEVTQQEQQPASPPQQEGAGQAPSKLTRAALRKLQPKIEKMSPEEKEQTRTWLENSVKEHEKEGERIAQHCLGL